MGMAVTSQGGGQHPTKREGDKPQGGPLAEAGSLLSEGLKASGTASRARTAVLLLQHPSAVWHTAHQAWSLSVFSVSGTPLGHLLHLRHLGISPHTRPEPCTSLMSDQVLRSPGPGCSSTVPLQTPLLGAKESLPRRGILRMYLEPLQPC